MVGRRGTFRPIATRRRINARHEVRTLVVAEQVAVRVALQNADRETGLPGEDSRRGPPASEQVADRALADLVILAERQLDDRRDDEAVRRIEDAVIVVNQRV